MTNKELAVKILELVGGKENITAVTHCITRLRMTIKDSGVIQEEEIKKLPGVMGVNMVENQYQVILGPKVADVFFEFEPLVGGAKGNDEPAEKKGIGAMVLDTFTGIFTPILPAIIGAGLLKGVLLFLMFLGAVSADSDLYQVLTIFSDAAYYFLPFLLASSTATHFKCNRYIAMVIAGILLHPNLVTMLSDGSVHRIFGIPITSASYGSSVLPIVLSIVLMSYVEKFFAQVVPNILRTVLVPLLTIIVMGIVTILVIGPAGTIVSNVLASNFLNFYVNYGVIAGAIFAGCFPLMVLLGIHNGFTPVMVQSIATYGVEYLMGLNVSSNSAQAGATFAVFLKTKNKDFKSMAGTAALNAILGITEPALYGVTTKLKRPLIGVCIGGAVGGAIAGFFHVTATGMATGPIIGIPLFLIRLDFGATLQWPETLSGWGCAIALAFFPTILSLLLMTVSIRIIGATKTAILGALEPVTAVAVGILVFGEQLTLRLALGILVILAAVTVVVSGKQLSGNLRGIFGTFPLLRRPR